MKRPSVRVAVAPEGWSTVTPRIVVRGARELVEFLKRVFGATGEYDRAAPTVVRIGNSVLMISDAGVSSPMNCFLYVYVGDTEETYRCSLEAGSRSVEEPAVMPYGDRRCMVEDKWGNTWQIATHLKDRDGA